MFACWRPLRPPPMWACRSRCRWRCTTSPRPREGLLALSVSVAPAVTAEDDAGGDHRHDRRRHARLAYRTARRHAATDIADLAALLNRRGARLLRLDGADPVAQRRAVDAQLLGDPSGVAAGRLHHGHGRSFELRRELAPVPRAHQDCLPRPHAQIQVSVKAGQHQWRVADMRPKRSCRELNMTHRP